MRHQRCFIPLIVLTLMLTLSCAHKPVSLYEALGGHTGIEKIADKFIENIAHDDQIFHNFSEANVTRFRTHFISHLCETVGGPCQYHGDSMQDIHRGMNISEGDFNRIVELLVLSMEEVQIPFRTQNRVLALLAPKRKDIIHL